MLFLSVASNIYKANLDLVALIHDSEMLRTEELVKAGELNFRGDRETDQYTVSINFATINKHKMVILT